MYQPRQWLQAAGDGSGRHRRVAGPLIPSQFSGRVLIASTAMTATLGLPGRLARTASGEV
jgi:hypothetical protein